ncbi:MAG: divalent-cation tolerance protein CutA [Candidatus Helarchaeota archaeon]|nr:divalent-cation tolerance protein CutA [Candidatus Helarchaeota archaeon]
MHKVVLVTASEEDGPKIAETLVKNRLAACVNIMPIRSIYKWKEKIEDDKESLLIIKTKSTKIDQLKKSLREIHPYEIPECIVLSIENGLPDYLNWIDETLSE